MRYICSGVTFSLQLLSVPFRWGLCSVFAWWRDSQRDPYSSSRFLRGGATGGASRRLSVGLNDATVRQAVQRLPSPLKRLMQQILDPNPVGIPLSKLTEGGDPCFTGRETLHNTLRFGVG